MTCPIVTIPNVVTTRLVSATGTTYDCGGSYPTTLEQMPWDSLLPDDVVNIHYRPAPYNIMLVLKNIQGTAAKKIRIHGVTDASGNRPILSGENAVFPNDHIAFVSTGNGWWPFVQGAGVISFVGPYGSKPKHVIVDSLEITKQGAPYQYTNTQGVVSTHNGGGGIYGVVGENIRIQNCVIHDITNGIFVNSRNNDPLQTSFDWEIVGNHIYDYGAVNSFLEHGSYIASVNVLYEGNLYGKAKAGTQGSMLKDRSSNPIIRANKFICGSTRILDIVEDQSGDGTGAGIIGNSPNYNGSFTVGNIFFMTPEAGNKFPVSPFHFGTGDTAVPARSGPHYFHNNTVISRRISAPGYFKQMMFDIEDGATVFAQNNIMKYIGLDAVYYVRNQNTSATPSLQFSGKNYVEGVTAISEYPMTGAQPLLNPSGTISSGLNLSFTTFEQLTGSTTIDAGLLPVLGSVQPDMQYIEFLKIDPRTVYSSAIDLGAIEFCSQSPVVITGPSTANIPPSGGVFQLVFTGTSPITFSSPQAGVTISATGLVTVPAGTGTLNISVTGTNAFPPSSTQAIAVTYAAAPPACTVQATFASATLKASIDSASTQSAELAAVISAFSGNVTAKLFGSGVLRETLVMAPFTVSGTSPRKLVYGTKISSNVSALGSVDTVKFFVGTTELFSSPVTIANLVAGSSSNLVVYPELFATAGKPV